MGKFTLVLVLPFLAKSASLVATKRPMAYYTRVRLSPSFRQEVEQRIDETLGDELEVQTRIRTRLTARLKELDKQEDRYIDLLDDPAWPEDKLKAKVAKLTEERKSIHAELEKVEHSLDAGRELLKKALDLLSNPQELFRQSARAERRVFTLTVFGKLFVQTREIVGHELNEPFGTLLDAELRRRAVEEEPDGDGQEPQGRAYLRAVALPMRWGESGDLAVLRAFQGDPGAP